MVGYVTGHQYLLSWTKSRNSWLRSQPVRGCPLNELCYYAVTSLPVLQNAVLERENT